MQTVPLGTTGRFTFEVGPQHLASEVKDPMLPPVLATPVMVLAMENAALEAVRRYLEPGEIVLGTAVDIRHLAATPAGQRVTATAEVTGIEGRRILFSVAAHDETEEIGRGTHERMVVDVSRLERRLAAKAGATVPGRPDGAAA